MVAFYIALIALAGPAILGLAAMVASIANIACRLEKRPAGAWAGVGAVIACVALAWVVARTPTQSGYPGILLQGLAVVPAIFALIVAGHGLASRKKAVN